MIRFLLPILLLGLIGCGGLTAKVNSNRTLGSTWECSHRDLDGGAPQKATFELTTDGKRFHVHKTSPYRDWEGTEMTYESDIVFDGTTMWEHQIKSYPTGQPDQAQEFSEVIQYTPDSAFLSDGLFWKIPKSLPTVEEGTEKIEGVECTLLASRQRSALGGEVIFRFWADPARGVLMKRADAVGEDSGGGSDAVLGSSFVCTDYNFNPTVDSSLFETPPEGGEKLMKWEWFELFGVATL